MANWSDIGKALRTARESRGFSVHDVAHRTRISIRALHELEEGDYSSFASPAYAKGFLAQYAEHLDMDASDWLDDFEVKEAPLDLKNYEFLNDQEEELPPHLPHTHSRTESESKEGIPSAALQPLAVFMATAMLLSAGVYGFIKLNERLSTVTKEEVAPPAPTPVTINAQRPDGNPRLSSKQGNPVALSPPLASNTPPPPNTVSPVIHTEEIAQPLAIETTPPRAVIVEE